MVGLGWYLDVIRSDSHYLVWVFEDFWKKSQKCKKKKNWARAPSPHRQSRMAKKATHGFVAAKQCFVAVKALFIEANFFSDFVPKASYSYTDCLGTLIND